MAQRDRRRMKLSLLHPISAKTAQLDNALRWYLSLIAATNSLRVDMLIRLAIRCLEDAPPPAASSLRQRI
jgi:hypothetical protein